MQKEITPALNSDSDLVNLKNYALGFARETTIQQEKKRPLYTIPKEIVLHGQSTGEFNSKYNADDIADKLITCLRGCSMDWARRNFTYDIEEYISSLTDMLFVSLL